MQKTFGILIPFVRAFIIEAEGSGASGAEKRQAVENALEAMWEGLQEQFKELRPYDFDDYRPYLYIAIDGLVSLFDSLFGKIWSFVEEYAIDPVEGLIGFDIDGDGDIDGEPVRFNLDPVE